MVNDKSTPFSQEGILAESEGAVKAAESEVAAEVIESEVAAEVSESEVAAEVAVAVAPTQDAVVEDVSEVQTEIAVEDSAEAEDIFANKSREELLLLFEKLLECEPIQSLRRSVDAIKVTFYKKYRAQVEELKREWLATGGVEEEFTPPIDQAESKLKSLLNEYRLRRDKYIADSDAQKEENLKIKLSIIEELKELINSEESIGYTFNKYKELQQRWRDVGLVPHQAVKDLWESYNLHVENFYNYININKELRDLDLKRNYEAKLALCEAAEALIVNYSEVEAFARLQKLHDEWRETGPVAIEYKESLWERFKAASSHINKAHQAHFDSVKSEQLSNLKLKEELCVKVETMVSEPHTTRKEWEKVSEELLDIQKVWKSIGFAPKKDNNKIYERFRVACDNFFELKRGFYASMKDEMTHNLELKTELCLAAESIQNSQDWKQTTEELLALQAKWKEVGAVSRRHADSIWKRFRAASDTFFARKAAAFSQQDSAQGDNLAAKLALLDEMESCDIAALGFEGIKSFQQRWSEIGFVPLKSKDEVAKRYKKVVDSLFSTLRGDEKGRRVSRFKDRMSTMKSSNDRGGDRGVRGERDKLYNKVKHLESDIALLENNIGFFSASKGAEALIAEVESKIARAKEELKETIEKIHIIDQQG